MHYLKLLAGTHLAHMEQVELHDKHILCVYIQSNAAKLLRCRSASNAAQDQQVKAGAETRILTGNQKNHGLLPCDLVHTQKQVTLGAIIYIMYLRK